MMLSSEATKANGQWWLSRLVYGAEKAFQFDEGIKGRKPEEFIGDSKLIRIATKLSLTKADLDRYLLGAEVLVIPLAEGAEPIDGKVKGYELHEATLILGRDRRKVETQFCQFQLRDNALSCTRFIELETEHLYLA